MNKTKLGPIGRKVLFLLVFLPVLGQPDEEFDIQAWIVESLIVAKVAGACGNTLSMTQFVDETQSLDGSQFVAKFVQWEAARLNRSVGEYLDACSRSIDKHQANTDFVRNALNLD